MTNLRKYFLTLIIFVIAIIGCAAFRAYYDVELCQVEKPAEAEERYGESKIIKEQEEGVNKYYFQDELVQIIWSPTVSGISFVLTNKTNHSIKIIWDEASYVDEGGLTHRVMHSGVKYIDRSNPQPPTVIVRKGTLVDFVFPTDYVYFWSDVGWWRHPLFPELGRGAEKLEGKTQTYVGKTIQVLLPLEVEGVVNEYIFTFKINSVEINKVKGYEPWMKAGWERK